MDDITVPSRAGQGSNYRSACLAGPVFAVSDPCGTVGHSRNPRADARWRRGADRGRGGEAAVYEALSEGWQVGRL